MAESISGTVGTAAVNKDYIDAEYMGDDGVAVDTS